MPIWLSSTQLFTVSLFVSFRTNSHFKHTIAIVLKMHVLWKHPSTQISLMSIVPLWGEAIINSPLYSLACMTVSGINTIQLNTPLSQLSKKIIIIIITVMITLNCLIIFYPVLKKSQFSTPVHQYLLSFWFETSDNPDLKNIKNLK